ncbi:fluoride efflux transporter FluC [Tsukamurella soli]|uniref:Fluoride-specific ion channel FluC n=1 Tax=Tsukamurella soli TaxID=644556 RepID=A0ABP8K507_9ACTN
MTALFVVLVGGFGGSLRLLVDGAIRYRWTRMGQWATFVVNVTGSLVLGSLAGLLAGHSIDGSLETVLATGLCGGYTTFSTASVETVRLLQERRNVAAVTYATVSLLVSLGACALGYVVAR